MKYYHMITNADYSEGPVFFLQPIEGTDFLCLTVEDGRITDSSIVQDPPEGRARLIESKAEFLAQLNRQLGADQLIN